MAESNGSGRLDRIEAALDRLEAAQERDHEERQRDFKQLMTWQVLTQDTIDKLLVVQKAQGEALDKRVNDLVGAIRDLIERIPPENLRR